MRLFLALELGALHEPLVSLQREWAARSEGWRWIDAGSLHVTLRFLGEVDEELDRRCRYRWRAVAAATAPISMSLSSPGCFPGRGRPRVLWWGLGDEPRGALAALAGSIETASRAAGFAAESRPFRAHVTLARARRVGRSSDARRGSEARWVDPPEPLGEVRLPCQPARELVLFRSKLDRSGARYTALERFALSHGTAGETT